MAASSRTRRWMPVLACAVVALGCAPVNISVHDVTGVDARGAKTGDVTVNTNANLNADVNATATIDTGGGGQPAGPATAAPEAPTPPAPSPRAYEGAVTTFAGSGSTISKDGVGAQAAMALSGAIATDHDGNLFFVDTRRGSIRRAAPDGTVSTVATIASANLRGLAVDSHGAVYVADAASRSVLKLAADGTTTPYVGGSSKGSKGGVGPDANLGTPLSLAFDAHDTLYVGSADQIFKVTPDATATLLVGNLSGALETKGYTDGWKYALFDEPIALAVAPSGLVYVADRANGIIRRIDVAAQQVTGLAGGLKGLVPGFAEGVGAKAQFDHPSGVAVDAAGYVYVADTDNHRIRRVAPDGTTMTIAGGSAGFADGVGGQAAFNAPSGLVLAADGTLYVADVNNARIRAVR